MMRPLAFLLLALGASPVLAQDPPTRPVLIDRSTPLRLMVLNEVSTDRAKAGERFPLRVDQPMVVDGRTIVPVGARAWGEVLSAERSGHLGKSGKLDVRLLSLELEGQQIPISGENRSRGESGSTQVALGVLGMGPLALLARGNNAKLKAGEIFSAYFETDMVYHPGTSRIEPLSPGSLPPPERAPAKPE